MPTGMCLTQTARLPSSRDECLGSGRSSRQDYLARFGSAFLPDAKHLAKERRSPGSFADRVRLDRRTERWVWLQSWKTFVHLPTKSSSSDTTTKQSAQLLARSTTWTR